MMKRTHLPIILLCLSLLSLSGCSSSVSSSPPPATQAEKKENIQSPAPAQPSEAAEKPLKESDQPKKEPVVEPAKATNKPQEKQTVEPAKNNPVAPEKPAAPKAQAPVSSPPARPKEEQKKQTVQLSVTGDAKHGTILAPAQIEITDGESVLDVLKRIAGSKHIQLEYSGFGPAAYVEGIDNLYEFDQGPKSGWMFRVNGEFAKKSAGSYSLHPGDQIEWLYTLDLGKDIGARP